MDSATTVLAQEAVCGITLQNGLLPLPEGAIFGLIAGDELADMLEDVEGQMPRAHSVEEIEPRGLSEDPGRDAFLDQRRAGAILGFIDLGFAFALEAKQAADDGGPAQHRDMGQMEDIVEAIIVSGHRIVRE